ncbi:class I SAM-dependent methyltransferase [Acidianus manzaensis]|uniref:Methyltransferase type 11 n=1 Tax=Acidianus manzaensis TaxID=282676 RepID=A0A1W6JYF7_9CREN|nr:class I SAM-dependent methyltransferase [Acidianus manzaensis]ARM75306.1 hypothetical protein B6F84_04165 [Acidianus manzaensis]
MSKASNENLRQIYDQLVKSYDKANSIITLGNDMKWRIELINLLSKYCKKPKIILDVGSGKGELTYIASKFFKTNIIQLDYSENMLKNSVIRENKILASFYNLPFKANSFDAVISGYSIHAADDMEKVIKEISRVTKRAVAITAIGKPDNLALREFLGIYIKYVQPYLVPLVGGKVSYYRYLIDIYNKIPTNSELKTILDKYFDIKVFKEKALGSIYIFIGIKRIN